jgi:hypothetical protein
MTRNVLLIEVLLGAIQREKERIDRANAEIAKLREELIDAGYVFESEVDQVGPMPDL